MPNANGLGTWQSGLVATHVQSGYGDPQLAPGVDSSADSRITVTYRDVGMPQPVMDAAVYIFHPPSVYATSAAGAEGVSTTRAELNHFLGVLRISGGVMLALTTRLLPESGSLSDPEVEATARARDLSMLQLANEGEMEMTEFLGIIETVKDATGELVVVNKLRSSNGLIMALAVKYQRQASIGGRPPSRT